MNESKVKNHYTKFDQAYRDSYGPILQTCRTSKPLEMLRYIGEKLQLKKGETLLDCGGGYGLPAAFFADNFDVEVVSLNITECQLEVARKNYPQVEHVGISFDNLDTLNRKFDKIMFLESFGHTQNISTLFSSVCERLNPGGVVFIKHPAASRRSQTITQIEEFYQYKFFSTIDMHLGAVAADLSLLECSVSPYGEYDPFLVNRFSNYVEGEKCFLHPNDPDFRFMKYYDFVFIKESYE